MNLVDSKSVNSVLDL